MKGMATHLDVTVCYLLLCSSTPVQRGQVRKEITPRDQPYFFELDLTIETIQEQQIEVEGLPVDIRTQVLDGRVWGCEAYFPLNDALAFGAGQRKRRITSKIRSQLLPPIEPLDLVEEYSILLMANQAGTTDAFVDEHATEFARLLRTVDKPLERAKALEVLERRVRYSKEDLTVIDWEGAIIMAEREDYESDIELLKVGIYQLLGYRTIDQKIDRSLNRLRDQIQAASRRLLPIKEELSPRQILEQRLAILLDFDKIDQEIMLIGDWYSAEVYRQLVEAFYLQSWKVLVKSKLEILAEVEETYRNRISLNWTRFLDWAQLIGWMVLLIGYVILFILEL